MLARPATPRAVRSKVIVTGLPVGLGSYVQWDRKLDGRLAHALMSIPAIKGIGIGLRPGAPMRPGLTRPRRGILPAPGGDRVTGVSRPTDDAGGLEGGVTNGEDLRVSAWMKPISTLMKPLRSVNLTTMGDALRHERSDVCASRRRLSWAKRWWRWSLPTPSPKSLAATRLPKSRLDGRLGVDPSRTVYEEGLN